jgi:hypothetical protein
MTGDIWIEVAEVPPDAGRFVRAISMPVYQNRLGVCTSPMKLQLNITAYVKHVVEESKAGEGK